MKLRFNFYFNTFFFFFSFCVFLLSAGRTYAAAGDYCDAYKPCISSCPCDDQGNTIWCNQQTNTCEQTCGNCSCAQCGGTFPPYPACEGSQRPACVRTRNCTCGGYYQIDTSCCVDPPITGGVPPTCVPFNTVRLNSCPSRAVYDMVPKPAECLTAIRNVTVNLSSTNTTSVSFDMNPVVTQSCTSANVYGNSFPYSPFFGVTLPAGSGDKKVCAKLTNAYGSGYCGAMIYLAEPPICTSFTNSKINNCNSLAEYNMVPKPASCITTSPIVNFNFINVSNVNSVSFDLNAAWAGNCGATNVWGLPEAFQSSYSKTLPTGNGDKRICAKTTTGVVGLCFHPLG